MGPFGGCRVYVGDIGRINRTDLEREFGQYGPVVDVWMGAKRDMVAQSFAFVVFRYPEDAEEAVRDRNGRKICGRAVRVEHARPAGQRSMRGNFRSNRDFRGPFQRRRSRSMERYEQRSRSPSPARNKISQTLNGYREERHRSSSQRKLVQQYSPSPSPEPKPKKSKKSKKQASPSPSRSPRRSRSKRKQAQILQSYDSRSSSFQSSSPSISPPPKKKQKKHKKQKTRSPSASPHASDEHDASDYEKKQDERRKSKSSKHKKKSKCMGSDSYSSGSE